MQAGHDQMLLMKSSWNTSSKFLKKNLACIGVGASFGIMWFCWIAMVRGILDPNPNEVEQRCC